MKQAGSGANGPAATEFLHERNIEPGASMTETLKPKRKEEREATRADAIV